MTSQQYESYFEMHDHNFYAINTNEYYQPYIDTIYDSTTIALRYAAFGVVMGVGLMALVFPIEVSGGISEYEPYQALELEVILFTSTIAGAIGFYEELSENVSNDNKGPAWQAYITHSLEEQCSIYPPMSHAFTQNFASLFDDIPCG